MRHHDMNLWGKSHQQQCFLPTHSTLFSPPNHGACMTGIILLINIISCDGDGGIRMPKAERIPLPPPLAQCFSRRQKVLFSGRNEERWLVVATGNAKAAISRGRFCGASHSRSWMILHRLGEILSSIQLCFEPHSFLPWGGGDYY